MGGQCVEDEGTEEAWDVTEELIEYTEEEEEEGRRRGREDRDLWLSLF